MEPTPPGNANIPAEPSPWTAEAAGPGNPPPEYAPATPPPYPPPAAPPYAQNSYPPAPNAAYPGYPAYPAYPAQWQYGAQPSLPTPPDTTIGPERVPWHWYDVLIPAWPFILTALAAFVTPVSKAGTTATQSSAPGMDRNTLLIVNLIVSALVYGYALLTIWWRSVQTYRVPWSALGIRKAPWWMFALMIPVYIVMALVAGGVGQLVNQLFYGGKAQNPQIDAITGGGGFSWVALITAILSASIIAPIVEELLFRGMLYGLLRSRWPSAVLAVTVDAALFATAHGIGLILASIFVVGVTLCIVYEKTKSTLVTMTLHSLFNTVSVITVFVTLATGGKLT